MTGRLLDRHTLRVVYMMTVMRNSYETEAEADRQIAESGTLIYLADGPEVARIKDGHDTHSWYSEVNGLQSLKRLLQQTIKP